jgi:hypothetical protein
LPRIHTRQPLLTEEVENRTMFMENLRRPVKWARIGSGSIPAGDVRTLSVQQYEILADGLEEARMTFNCDAFFQTMSEAGVLNRGTDCDEPGGMINLAPIYNRVPYVWSLPHYYLVPQGENNPREQLKGMLTPSGDRYRSLMYVEEESGRVVMYASKDQLSVRLFPSDGNYIFTQNREAIIPLYWSSTTRNSTRVEAAYLQTFQRRFGDLSGIVIVCGIVSAVLLLVTLAVGTILYRDAAILAVREKRKRIQHELESAIPEDYEGKDAEGMPLRGHEVVGPKFNYIQDVIQ